jgi:uncharacterized protein YjiS (DUF1127 family)
VAVELPASLSTAAGFFFAPAIRGAPRIESADARCFRGVMTNRFVVLLRLWLRRARTRRDISQLDSCTIRDLGISPSQMVFEAKKPFWRA